MNTVECQTCGMVYDENKRIYPNCGSNHKRIYLSCNPLPVVMQTEVAGMKGKNTHLTGKRKIEWEWKNTNTTRVDNGAPVHHFRLIDRKNNFYEEIVTDINTGDIIHECCEPLSEHQNHGSAKNKK